MCGVSFYFSKNANLVSKLEKSLKSIEHRGPDAQGLQTYEIDGKFVGIGHVRLSIIDLAERSNQPFEFEENIISYNGEIYNFKSIKEDLENLGAKFNTLSDTEVIIQGYKFYGIDIFKKLNGIYAVVILDKSNKKLIYSRDPMGVKQLYYSVVGEDLFISSEIRGIKPFVKKLNISNQDVFEFMTNHYLYEPSTGFSNVKKVMPGQVVTLDIKSNKYEYITVKPEIEDLIVDNNLLQESIKSQEMSDVRNVILFSGGLDSTLIAKEANENKLLHAKFSSGFINDEDYYYSKLVSKELKKKQQVIDIKSKEFNTFIEEVDFIVENTEDLIADYTFIPSYQLLRHAREDGYKVALSGMGADELFGGYPRYLPLLMGSSRKYVKIIFNVLKPILHFLNIGGKKMSRFFSFLEESNDLIAFSRLNGYLSKKDMNLFYPDSYKAHEAKYLQKLKSILLKFPKQKDLFSACEYLERYGFLTRNLLIADKSSMLTSMELRVPLLDRRVVTLSSSLNTNEKLNFSSTKLYLKKYLKSRISKNFLNRRKVGFNPPLESYIAKLKKSEIIRLLNPVQDYFKLSSESIYKKLEFDDKNTNVYKIWQLIYLARWLKKYDKND